MGMSGVGKTHLSGILRKSQWYHYSSDYRIGTRYLDEPIIDMIKQHAILQPFLKELLRKDWISIESNIRFNDLGPLLSFIGKPGNPLQGGLELPEFIHRQELYRQAGINASLDVPQFIEKAESIYHYPHFVNDSAGSLCDFEEPKVIETLAKHTVIIYIKVDDDQQLKTLIERSQSHPKPLYFRPEFFQQQLTTYLEELDLSYMAEINPDDFIRWIFPRLLKDRIPRYEEIAKQSGYMINLSETKDTRDAQDFDSLIERTIAKGNQ